MEVLETRSGLGVTWGWVPDVAEDLGVGSLEGSVRLDCRDDFASYGRPTYHRVAPTCHAHAHRIRNLLFNIFRFGGFTGIEGLDHVDCADLGLTLLGRPSLRPRVAPQNTEDDEQQVGAAQSHHQDDCGGIKLDTSQMTGFHGRYCETIPCLPEGELRVEDGT